MDVLDHCIYSLTCKAISVRLLCVIADRNNLDIMCGDIGNAYVNAETAEQIYVIAGKEFGAEKEGQTVIIKKALYGLASSSRQWHAMLASTLCSAGWKPTCYDHNVWIRLHKKSQTYEYITTYVDDFMIFSREPKPIMD